MLVNKEVLEQLIRNYEAQMAGFLVFFCTFNSHIIFIHNDLHAIVSNIQCKVLKAKYIFPLFATSGRSNSYKT